MGELKVKHVILTMIKKATSLCETSHVLRLQTWRQSGD